ncbi:E3 ubiquitin-protein ligase RNF185-like [Drosophila madeirensis]|uniref:E3 ubiquitin-protein ligase RNF185-like n=1 Tax=Drosophila madeirensis TaxID=30013 RepID=A0AAU9G293_DROMD
MERDPFIINIGFQRYLSYNPTTRTVQDIPAPADPSKADIKIEHGTDLEDYFMLSFPIGATESLISNSTNAPALFVYKGPVSTPLNVAASGSLGADASSENFGYECPICLLAAFDRGPVATPCGHIFCRGCIEEQIRRRNKCAKCNREITADQLVRLYL